MKVLITGSSSAGKTSVTQELKRQGFSAYSTDEVPGVTQLENRLTGEPTDWPEGFVDWDLYAWNWVVPEVRKLLQSDETVFIGAIVNNQADNYHLFDKVVVLTVDIDTLIHRIQNRKDRDPDAKNIERMVQNHLQCEDKFIEDGAIPVDNNGTAEETLKKLLLAIGLSSNDN